MGLLAIPLSSLLKNCSFFARRRGCFVGFAVLNVVNVTRATKRDNGVRASGGGGVLLSALFWGCGKYIYDYKKCRKEIFSDERVWLGSLTARKSQRWRLMVVNLLSFWMSLLNFKVSMIRGGMLPLVVLCYFSSCVTGKGEQEEYTPWNAPLSFCTWLAKKWNLTVGELTWKDDSKLYENLTKQPKSSPYTKCEGRNPMGMFWYFLLLS